MERIILRDIKSFTCDNHIRLNQYLAIKDETNNK